MQIEQQGEHNICTMIRQTSGLTRGNAVTVPPSLHTLRHQRLHLQGVWYPPPFVIAMQKYGINTVPTPTVA